VRLEKKGRNLRLAARGFLKTVANSKKINPLEVLRILSPFGRPLALPLVDACLQVIVKMKSRLLAKAIVSEPEPALG